MNSNLSLRRMKQIEQLDNQMKYWIWAASVFEKFVCDCRFSMHLTDTREDSGMMKSNI